jgi:hypothetical protein
MGEQKKRGNFVTSRTPTNACLDCGGQSDAATSLEHGKKPSPGAITICIRCSHIMAYDNRLRLRELNDEEMRYVAGDKDILRYVKALGEVREARKKNANNAD